MTPQQHPNVLGALSALADLADQYGWLADLLEPGTPDRRPTHLTPAAKAVRVRQWRAERADLAETLRNGHAPRGASPAPLQVAVLDAQIAAVDAAVDAAHLACSALRTRAMLGWSTPHADDQVRFESAVGYLKVALRLIAPELAGVLGTDLHHAAQQAARITGTAAARIDFGHGPCPACGRRSLVAQVTSIFDNALITCTRPDCRCRGTDCLCRRPTRVPDLRHIWPSAEFEQLRDLYQRQKAAA